MGKKPQWFLNDKTNNHRESVKKSSAVKNIQFFSTEMSERRKIGDSCNFRAREKCCHITPKNGLIKNRAAVKMTRNLEKVQSEIILSDISAR